MTSTARLDAAITAWLQDGPTGMTAGERAAISDAAEQVAQRRGIVLRWRAANPLPYRLAAVALAMAAVLLAAAVIGPSVGRPRPTPLVWTLFSFGEPFPAPLRNEPVLGAPLVAAALTDVTDPRIPDGKAWTFVDVSGDTAPEAVAFADLVSLEFRANCWRADSLCLWYHPGSGLTRPFPSPLVEWFAYGVDFDNDGDGRADMRFGVDNQAADALRAWSTDLRTGETTYRTGVWPDDPRLWEVELPMADGKGAAANRGYAFLHPELTTTKGYFYAWSAVIRGGQIVAMDFAPDAGWLDSRPDDDESKWGGRP
jgi:hypothetical protein